MGKYLDQFDATTIPFCESPFFYPLLEKMEKLLTPEEIRLCIHFYEEGWVVVDSGLPEEVLDRARDDAVAMVGKPGTKTQVGYEYNESPRIFEAWKQSEAVRQIALNPRILRLLEILYRRTPVAFQTINFLRGSAQPLHSDAIHFGTIPQLWVTAAWTALEDMTEANGTLWFISRSHRLPIYDYHDIRVPLPQYGTDQQFATYAEYEEFVRQLVSAKFPGETPTRFLGKKGQVLIWAANLIHGGAPITDPLSTRHSQASHYTFDGVKKFFVPRYSTPLEGQYVEKKLGKSTVSDPRNWTDGSHGV